VAVMHGPSDSAKGTSFIASLIEVFAEPFFYNYLSFLFFMVTIFACLMWLAEHEENSAEFPKRFIDGIDDGIWWAVVTVTTVGYGDKAPKTAMGRIIACVWMLLGLALGSILVGHMSERFTSNIASAGDGDFSLSYKRVCGYPVTFRQPWLEGFIFTAVEAADVAACAQLYREGAVDAILMDQPIMSYFRRTDSLFVSDPMFISSTEFPKPRVGIIFPEQASTSTDFRTLINAALLEMVDAAEMHALQQRWFPPSDSETLGSHLNELNYLLVVPAIAVVALYIVTQVLCSGYHARQLKRIAAQGGEKVVNVAEHLARRDLDGDGDVGRAGSPSAPRVESWGTQQRPLSPHTLPPIRCRPSFAGDMAPSAALARNIHVMAPPV